MKEGGPSATKLVILIFLQSETLTKRLTSVLGPSYLVSTMQIDTVTVGESEVTLINLLNWSRTLKRPKTWIAPIKNILSVISR